MTADSIAARTRLPNFPSSAVVPMASCRGIFQRQCNNSWNPGGVAKLCIAFIAMENILTQWISPEGGNAPTLAAHLHSQG